MIRFTYRVWEEGWRAFACGNNGLIFIQNLLQYSFGHCKFRIFILLHYSHYLCIFGYQCLYVYRKIKINWQNFLNGYILFSKWKKGPVRIFLHRLGLKPLSRLFHTHSIGEQVSGNSLRNCDTAVMPLLERFF